MDADALDRGWTTDGRGLWHCPECPSLIDQALKVENVDEGQEPLAPDIGVDEQEVLLRRAGYVPWVP